MDRYKTGFTIVELSITLVIIGLLVGGVMTGRNLIRASEVRSISDELNRHVSAINLFQQKYTMLPGDFSKATRLWGSSPNCPATNAQATSDGTTCDGNGNGMINANSGTGNNEYWRSWQHMSNAGLTEGSFSGVVGPGDTLNHAVIGWNVPESNIGSVGWSMIFQQTSGSTNRFQLPYWGNILILGGETDAGTSYGAFLSPAELYSLDQKIDDGRPADGSVIARWWDECTDAASNTDLDANYLLTEDDEVCSVMFRNFFDR